MNWIYLSVAIIGEVVGTSALKASEGFSKPLAGVISVLAFAVALYFLSLTLKVIPIGIVYAIWSGVGIVLISILGYFMFEQRLDLPAIIGICLIILGVLVINTMSSSVVH